ncbi:choline BCCT transporter BetT [Pelagicoccus sp. NFK12]|uniref:Choline BCCT transporter BetT n=1 Tax=Pelagicoccus enzymogenes TaxID=2773457 RepID=A0A927FDZ7_9BACT|nr:choline BCCT transporter BetT [Pelagicoccus enzymogenes]MBD5781940.1 choline BCCT transporter BetT [Pelagicoccus enzymogenes]
MEENEKGQQKRFFRMEINPPVFYGSALLILVFVLFGAVLPEQAQSVFGGMQDLVTEKFGWFYVLAVAGFLVFVLLVAVSRYGDIKLGPDHSEPDYSYTSWFAMLFSAGMGIGLMFFGVAEPVMHFAAPPEASAETVEAARDAMRITFFHWGMHAWAIYAVVALSLAYFAFRHNLPLTIRSAFYPLIGDRIYGPIGHAADIFAVLGTLFGVATSLGFGVIQVNSGLNYLFGMPVSPTMQVVLIVVITGFASLSVGLGLDSGIRRISELNVVLALSLLLFVLVTGPTFFIAETFVQNTGNYLSNLFESTFNLYAYEPRGWIGGWTLFYWGWWIAWSPFVGMFIARVSRGRTIRQFVIGVLFVPVGFTFLWLTVFGDTALHMILEQGIAELATAVSADTSVALFKFFEHLPFSSITSFVATLLVITFFVTSSDSGSLVVDMLTSGGKAESPLWQRLFWASAEGVVAITLLLAGGLGALQAATIASALPFALVMVFMCWGLMRSLRVESAKMGARPVGRPILSGEGKGVAWQHRLGQLLFHPKEQEVLRFIDQVVEPAFEDVKRAFAEKSVEGRVARGEDGRCWFEVGHGEEPDFYYSIRVVPYEAPAFAMVDTKGKRLEELRYCRPEVYLIEGGQGYQVMNWSKDEIIHDVLDQYERHLNFMEAIR